MSVVYVLTTLIPEDGDDATVEQLMKRAKTMRFLRGQIYGEDASSKKLLVSNFTNYKMIDSRLVMEQYNELIGILGRFTQHKINMDEAIQLSCIIDKLHPSWKDFKHALKHLKEELTRVKLGSHLRIEKSLRVQDSDKPKGNNVVGPLVVNMMEHNNSTRDCKGVNVGNKANGSGTKGSVDGSSNSLKGQNMFNKSLQVYYVTYVSKAYFVQDDDVVWWVNSGATVHVYKDRCLFNDEYIVMTRNYFLEYTRLDIPEFRDTLIQNMDYVKKSIEKRALHKMEYDSRVNERLTQTTEEKVDSSKALDASLVIIESNGTESQEQDTSSRSGNDAHVDDADIRPIYNEEPMAEVQTSAEINIFATGQQHTEQPEFNNEGEVDQNTEQCHDIRPLPAKLTDNRTTELSNQLLESENVCLKKTVAQCQKDFAKLEAHCINLELQMENNVLKSGQQSKFLKEKSNEAKVKNDIDVTETINIELEHSVAKLLVENEQLHKEKEHLKQTYKDLFDSIKRTRVQTKDQNDSLMAQLNNKSNENVDVLAQIQKKGFAIAALKNELRKLTGNSVNTKFAKPSILGKPVLQPHRNQFVVRQPTAFKSERPKISKERFASQVDVSNDLLKPVTTHYLPKRRESAPGKPHYMIATSSSRYSSNDIVHNHYLEEAKKKTHEHSRIPRNFFDSKHFVCSTCQKCIFNANHDACVIKFLKEVNSRAKVPSNKTTNRNKPIEQIRVATKPKRQIPKGHRYSIKKTTTIHEKTTSPRSCLRWQPTGRILKTVYLRWVPTGKTFTSSTTKVESEPLNGSNADIPNQCESEQALNVSAGTLLSTGTSFNPTEEGLRAPFLNVQKTFEHNSSSLGHQCKMTFEHSSSSLGRQCQMMSDHNSSDLAPQRQEMSVENVSSGLVPQGQKASDYDNSDPVPPRRLFTSVQASFFIKRLLIITFQNSEFKTTAMNRQVQSWFQKLFL
ncbi:hypothetical protein Tco_0755047 [Tanacetum coccineum]